MLRSSERICGPLYQPGSALEFGVWSIVGWFRLLGSGVGVFFASLEMEFCISRALKDIHVPVTTAKSRESKVAEAPSVPSPFAEAFKDSSA